MNNIDLCERLLNITCLSYFVAIRPCPSIDETCFVSAALVLLQVLPGYQDILLINTNDMTDIMKTLQDIDLFLSTGEVHIKVFAISFK